MKSILLIALGGAVGSILRYGLSGWTHRWMGETLPWGTLCVNLLGCFTIGLLWAASERAPLGPSASAFLFIGVLGAFTTFSTFGLESINLLRDGEVWWALANVLAHNIGGLLLAASGFVAARALMG